MASNLQFVRKNSDVDNKSIGQLRVSVLIPTYNAGRLWQQVIDSINEQTFPLYRKIIVDSESKDETVDKAKANGFEVIAIPNTQFNHGSTRQLLIDQAMGSDIGVFLTQDAILADKNSIGNLVAAFADPAVALAYGRQLPRANARPLETHARLFNYPSLSHVRARSDKDKFGFKTIFFSNSFAAYRIDNLKLVGGFPSNSIMGEDTITAAKMLNLDYKIAYTATATVFHSHSYTVGEEFRRYFDTRVFHEQNKWLIEGYGKPTGEGLKYVISELRFVLTRHPYALIKIVGSTFAKWAGYSTGKYYKSMSQSMLKMFSMHRSFWR